MEFGWINIFGAAIVILIMIPNIIYAVKHKQTEAEKDPSLGFNTMFF